MKKKKKRNIDFNILFRSKLEFFFFYVLQSVLCVLFYTEILFLFTNDYI